MFGFQREKSPLHPENDVGDEGLPAWTQESKFAFAPAQPQTHLPPPGAPQDLAERESREEAISESFKASDSDRTLHCYRLPAINNFFFNKQVSYSTLLSAGPQNRPSQSLRFSPPPHLLLPADLSFFFNMGISSAPCQIPPVTENIK